MEVSSRKQAQSVSNTRSAEKLAPVEQAYYDSYDWGKEHAYHREVLLDIEALLPPSVRTIADIGCGDGIITNHLATSRFVVGIDSSLPALAAVTRPKAGGSILDLPFGDDAFDLVMANDVLEHLGPERRAAASAELERIARDYIIITVPFLENLATRQRLVDGAFRHVNLHFESLDIAKLRDSFRDFSLRACVFSGVTWEDEVDEVERLKVLRAAIEADPFLARRRASLLELVDAEMVVARRKQAAFLSQHPEEIDGLLRRTELICFFARKSLDWVPPAALAAQALDLTSPSQAASEVSLTEIDFRTAAPLRRESIPVYAPLPYWIPAGEIRADSDGVTFIAPDAAPLSVKFGFFAALPATAKLCLEGRAPGDGTLSVSHYAPMTGYRQIHSQAVPAGAFALEIADFAPSVTEYGYLFDVTFTGRELALQSVRIDHGDAPAPMRRTHAADKPYQYRHADGLHLFVSRRIDAAPMVDLTWFQDIETRRGLDGFRYFFEPKDVYVEISRLELSRAEDGMRRAAAQNHADALARIDELTRRLEAQGQAISALEHGCPKLTQDCAVALDRIATQDAALEAQRQALSGLERGVAAAGQEIEALGATLRDGLDTLKADIDSLPGAIAADIRDVTASLEATIDSRMQQREENALRETVVLAAKLSQTEAEVAALKDTARAHGDALTYLGVVTGALRRLAKATRPLRHSMRRRFDVAPKPAPRPAVPAQPVALPAAPRPVAAVTGVPRLPATVTMLVADDRIDRRVLHQARTLTQQGASLTIIAAPYPGPRDMDQVEFPELKIFRIDTSRAVDAIPDAVSRLRADRDWQEHYFYHHQFLVEALKHPAEAYVAHDLPVLPAAVAAADQVGAAVVYDAHELYPEQKVFGEARQQLYRDVEAEVIGLADAVSTVNLSIAEEMAKRYGIAVPSVILNATDVGDREVPVARTELLRNGLGIPKDRRILLFQGSLSVNRNLENLVAALPYVTTPDMVLVIMGPGDQKREELRLVAESLGIGPDRLLFHEAVPQRVLLDYTASADAGVIPYPGVDINTIFCTPNKLFEFIAAGLPIIANDLPELRRFVADGGFGIVRPMTTAREIAAAIDAFFATDQAGFRERLRTGAHEMIWPAQTDVLLGTYRTAMLARDQRVSAAVSGNE